MNIWKKKELAILMPKMTVDMNLNAGMNRSRNISK